MAAEASRRTAGDAHEAIIVCEKLRAALTRVAGVEAFDALMRRSLVLARADVPALKDVTVGGDGCVNGLEEAGTNAGIELTAQFLWLLATFIGEPIAIWLVSETWPAEKIYNSIR